MSFPKELENQESIEAEKREKLFWKNEEKYQEHKMGAEDIESIDIKLLSKERKALSQESKEILTKAWNIERMAYKKFGEAFHDWIMNRINKEEFQKIQAEWNLSYKELQRLKAKHGDI